MEIKNHFGVYAVWFENGKLLCIEKTRGPYQHRYDLPGGSQRPGEGLTEPQVAISEAVSDGVNDSLEYVWKAIQEITEENVLPVILKVKAELLGFPELGNTSYMNWKVNDEKPTCP